MLRQRKDRKKKKAVKRVVWADEVGRKLLVSKDVINGEVKTLPEVRCSKARDEVRGAREVVTAEQQRGNGVGEGDPPGDLGRDVKGEGWVEGLILSLLRQDLIKRRF
uniref:Uncharacterized protein n=1 Tax=Ananas comosus var. bracteatus TaxID=296719 RepID=A0A6V7P5S1_ANACO|nr:unnamed protein product [Ananas comosus var. bracteatus]